MNLPSDTPFDASQFTINNQSDTRELVRLLDTGEITIDDLGYSWKAWFATHPEFPLPFLLIASVANPETSSDIFSFAGASLRDRFQNLWEWSVSNQKSQLFYKACGQLHDFYEGALQNFSSEWVSDNSERLRELMVGVRESRE